MQSGVCAPFSNLLDSAMLARCHVGLLTSPNKVTDGHSPSIYPATPPLLARFSLLCRWLAQRTRAPQDSRDSRTMANFPTLALVAALAALVLSTAALLRPAWFFRPPTRKTVVILVLGDVGRSPRMMYHAESFAKAGWRVRLVGYPGGSLRAGSRLCAGARG